MAVASHDSTVRGGGARGAESVARFKDLTGQRFGRLTCIEFVGRNKSYDALWRCHCSCGNEHVTRAGALKNGHTQSCGCLQRDAAKAVVRYHDLTGQVFGRLTTLRIAEKIRGRMAWLCLCECGRQKAVRADCLTKGVTRSCGCFAADVHRQTPHYHNIAGRRFGRLVAVERTGLDSQGRALWKCKCECGAQITAPKGSLQYGGVQSCGCLRKERSIEATTTHGLSGGRERGNRPYRIWLNMKQRCSNPKAAKFHLYGGRGIRVCDEWANDFAVFHAWAMANGYRDDLSIDRKDNDGNYEPGNCRWATRQEQSLNTRQNRIIRHAGEERPLAEWAASLGMKYSALRARLDDHGWSVERALSTPVKRRRERATAKT